MRILYVHPKAWTGDYPLLRKLSEAGNEVNVLEEWRDMPGPPVRVTDYFRNPGDRLRTYWYDPRRGWEKLLTWPVDRFFKAAFEGRNLLHRMVVIRRAVRYFKPDALLCAEGFAYAIPAAFLRRLRMLPVPLVVSYIGGDILDVPEADVGKRRTPLTAWLIRQSMRSIDRFRPFSPLLRDALLAEGAASERIEIIPGHLVVDASEAESVRRRKSTIRTQIGERYGIDDSAPLIVTLGGNQKGKGLHILADAWPTVLAAVPDARWLLCGPQSAWIAQQVWPRLQRAGCVGTVVAAGRLEGLGVFEHLAAADLHVTPTLCDGGPMVNIEAAAVATPTLTTEMAGNSYWLKEYGCGEVVPAGDSGTLAATLAALLSDPGRLAALREHCPAMTSLFALEQVTRRLSDLLESAVTR